LDDQLIWWRAVHFAATIVLAGAVLFFALVAGPAFSKARKDARLPARVGFVLRWLAWISLAVVVVSGLAWLILLAQHLSDGTVTAVLLDGIVWIVLTKTGFGATWVVRFALVVVIGACLPITSERPNVVRRWAAAIAAACLVGALGFAGHAAAGAGVTGLIHLAADVAHLVAAAAWLGALLPLALLLHAAGQSPDQSSMTIARRATQRFSTLGVASVSTLVGTGIVNTWVLAGSVSALLDTDYGRLLLVKVALFLIMVATAAVNRLVLTPRLLQEFDLKAGSAAVRRLRNNSLIETAIGVIILVIVAVLGTLPPALHEEVAATSAVAL
jgi:copper resistance protein D